jgi:hypothetical protein
MSETRLTADITVIDPPAGMTCQYFNDEAPDPVNMCCFCRHTFHGYGHNPTPLLNAGVACDACNHSIVFPARLKAFFASKKRSDFPTEA